MHKTMKTNRTVSHNLTCIGLILRLRSCGLLVLISFSVVAVFFPLTSFRPKLTKFY